MSPSILAIETATHACSVALLTADNVYGQYMVEPQIHTKVILDMVDKVLAQAHLQLADLDAFAFGQGPGSFTGLRIAASVIQGLAFGSGKPVVPISSLQALAQLGFNKTGARDILPTIDARMHEIYWGAYSVDAQGLMQPVITDRVQAEIAIPGQNLSKFKQIGMNTPEMQYPRAEEVAQLAVPKFLRGEVVDASGVVPVYIRNDVV